jgi:N utilization substance protein A
MSSELMDALKALAREKNIDEYQMLDKLEQSLAGTYQRILDLDNNVRVTIDRESGRIYVYELVPVGEVDEETGEAESYDERDVTPADVSRIAAQNAKNVIGSIIREAERERIFDEYADRIGESVTGTVQQSDSRYTLIKLREGVEALLPPRQRALRPQPAHQGLHHRRAQDEQRAVDRRVPHASRPDSPPLRDRGARGLRRHRRDQERRP